MDRTELGDLLMLWHGGQDDPVYAVASFYVGDKRYPKKSIVKDALSSLKHYLDEFERMQRREVILVQRNGRQVSLRDFAGYTASSIDKNAVQLRRIIRALRKTIKQDYSQGGQQ